MNLNDNAIEARSSQRRVIRSVIVSVLATAAILLGLLAIHSTALGNEMGVTLPATSADAEHPGETAAMAVAGAAAASVAAITYDGWLDCALMAMTCALLLVLARLVILTRRPSMYHRLRDAARYVVRYFPSLPLHIYRPSLTVLSISRR